METLAALRFSVSPRRHNVNQYFTENDNESALSTPYASAPTSPRRGFAREVEETPLGEVRAAVPFLWESSPGTPRKDIKSLINETPFPTESDVVESESRDHGSSSSSSLHSEMLSRESSNSEFEFSSRFTGVEETINLSPPSIMSTAEDLFSNGQLLPLRLPPRLQAVKTLRNLGSSCSDDSGNSSFRNPSCPVSPRSPRAHNLGGKLIAMCGLAKSPERETIILGMEEKKPRSRSLSPLRLFKRNDSSMSNFFSDKLSLSGESASSASSSSSSSSENSNTETHTDNWPFFQEGRYRGRTLQDILYTDKAPDPISKIGSAGLSTSKEMMEGDAVNQAEGVKALPRVVESRRDMLKKNQSTEVAVSHKIDRTCGKTPSLSRSNARSFARSSVVLVDVEVKPSRKEHMSRAIFGNRFGVLASCLGIPVGNSRHS